MCGTHRCIHILSSKVADFGMARDLVDETYYKSSGGKIPVKWTAPEVRINNTLVIICGRCALFFLRYSFTVVTIAANKKQHCIIIGTNCLCLWTPPTLIFMPH